MNQSPIDSREPRMAEGGQSLLCSALLLRNGLVQYDVDRIHLTGEEVSRERCQTPSTLFISAS